MIDKDFLDGLLTIDLKRYESKEHAESRHQEQRLPTDYRCADHPTAGCVGLDDGVVGQVETN